MSIMAVHDSLLLAHPAVHQLHTVAHWVLRAPAAGGHTGFILAADANTVAPSGPVSAQTYAERVQALPTNQGAHLGWLTAIGTGFIGVFQKGGSVFEGFVTGIIPTLVVLMTAFYAVTEFVGEQRVHGIARFAGKIALTRYTVLPILAVFFLTNPMAYTFGTFLDEKYKPAFYDSAVSFVHPALGLFPHCNPGEYFVWGGVLVALLQLEKEGKVPPNFHVTVAIYYFGVGVVVILLKGIMTEWVTRVMARRQGVVL
ncbi:PTS glucitol/sorbitol transporter subunit IIC [Acidisoma cellulosilytica]|uniref:PTS glucitol/sorbitol transporter subunit IIC n=1 Tax=Acidisoma cellulosilyticum TaxID=2802395 RepID=A0A964E4E6_9PROT|nr:PTS glucitol/sorbitol transporter subunit IIC [Acidisoma cellulosilyticum]MCB8881386.1 PTS glucitol/sorbitol transporter subunit IIC [Acidisoma cellulosilyticum]